MKGWSPSYPRSASSFPDCSIRSSCRASTRPGPCWPPVLDVIEAIKNAGVQVVLCTNGIRLNRPDTTARIIELGVDAVSVSLDSTDPAANDRYRPAHRGEHGWHDVVSGIRSLLAVRGTGRPPRVGVYTVITRRNLSQVHEMGALAAGLGCDYYVPQPVSLAPDHPCTRRCRCRRATAQPLRTRLITCMRRCCR
jgi:sulfatase maturation enzyme AslB (radical SAM superfamily)